MNLGHAQKQYSGTPPLPPPPGEIMTNPTFRYPDMRVNQLTQLTSKILSRILSEGPPSPPLLKN